MKYIYAFLALISVSGCYTYQNFVPVTDRTDVPAKATEFYVATDLAGVRQSLQAATVASVSHEFGLETEEILLDEGTRALYKVYSDSLRVKVVPYWSYTEKVKSEATLWAGYAAASSMDGQMQRIVYNKNQLRPKKVFDYGVELFGKAGPVSFK